MVLVYWVGRPGNEPFLDGAVWEIVALFCVGKCKDAVANLLVDIVVSFVKNLLCGRKS